MHGPEQEPAFGARLRGLRERAGLTQEALAARAGLTPNAISDLERGKRQRPYPHTISALGRALELGQDELTALRGSVAAPATVRAPLAPTLLPVPPTPLIGRQDDVETVRQLLHGDGPRLVTLVGAGGVGKTRLALEVARGGEERFPDGVVFVALAAVTDPALVVPSLVEALRLREAGGRSAREVLHGYLADRRMLIVLDNVEHLLAAADEVAAALAAGPGLRVLATSRAPLRIRGERLHPVSPLAVPDAARVTDVETVVASPAAQVFLERAREANPAFFLTRHNAAVVAAICWRLDGLPLALELAAARTRFLGATELLTHLDQALRSVGARDLPERQRTLQATLDWSHDLLSAPERAVFRRLSVFAGGFTLPAAAAVGATTDVVDVLGSLVDQSLVTVRTSPEGDLNRYVLLEPVRAYALEQLAASGEEDAVRTRHARFFEVLADRAGPELQRAEQASWMEDLAVEHDNLRAALRQLLDLREPERVAEIGWRIHRFWSLRGHTAEGRAWMERALADPDALSDRATARARYVVGMLSFVRGELDRAGVAAHEAAAAARASDDAEVLASASMGIGLALLSSGDPVAAAGFLSEALSRSRELEDASVTALTLGGLARIALADAEPARAAELLAEAEAVSRAAGDSFTLAATLISQALAARLRGDDLRAGVLLRQSVQCAAELRDAWHLVLSLSGLAGVAARQGLPHRATRLLGAVEGLSARMGVDVPWSTWQELDRFDAQRLREQLGAAAFDQARSRGRALQLEAAVAEALADDERPTSP